MENVLRYEEKGYSPLHLACQKGNVQMVEKLLPYYENQQVQLELAVEAAMENGHTDLAFQLSIKYKIDLSMLGELCL